MARITPYQQQRLESSIVGTPGVDQSGSNLASAIGQVTNLTTETANYAQRQDNARAEQMGRTISSFAQDVGQGIVADVAYARQKKKEMDTLRNSMASDYFLNQLSSSNASTIKGLKEKYGTDTFGMEEEYTKTANDAFNEVVKTNGLQNRPEVLSKISGGWSTITRESFKHVTEYQYDMEKNLAQARVERANNDYKLSMSNAQTPEEANQAIEAHNLMYGTALAGYGPVGELKMQTAHKEGVMNFLQARARADYEVTPENLYQDFNKDSQTKQWVSNDVFRDTLDAGDKQKVLEWTDKYKQAALTKQQHFIEWEGTKTELLVSKLVSSTVVSALQNGDPAVAVDALVTLDQMRAAEEAKPEWARNKRVSNDIEAATKYLGNLGISVQGRVQAAQDRAVEIKRAGEGDRRSDIGFNSSEQNRADAAARESKEGVAAQLKLATNINTVLKAVNNNKASTIPMKDIRALNTQVKDAFAHGYIELGEYKRYAQKLHEASEEIAPPDLRDRAKPNDFQSFFSDATGLEYEITRNDGISQRFLDTVGVPAGSAQHATFNKQVREIMDGLVKTGFGGKQPRGAQVARLKMIAEKRVFEDWAAGEESKYVKPKADTAVTRPIKGPVSPFRVPPPPDVLVPPPPAYPPEGGE